MILVSRINYYFDLNFRYCKPFTELVSSINKTLVGCGDLLELWHSAQAALDLLLASEIQSNIPETANIFPKYRQVSINLLFYIT